MTAAEFNQLRNQSVPTTDIATVENGAAYIIIGRLENSLDELNWTTSNFQHTLYKDGYANLCVMASLELGISYTNQDGQIEKRTFVGACNFSLSSLEPNTHFLATTKSECIKNAASDIGKYFGRGINDNLVPTSRATEKQIVKANPDSKIMKQFMEAVEKGDTATQNMLSNIYEIKTQTNEKKDN